MPLKNFVVAFCVMAAAGLFLLGIVNSEEGESNAISVPQPPEHISELLTAISNGLVTLDNHLRTSEIKNYNQLTKHNFRLDIVPDDDEQGWFMTVRFLPEKPSSLMWIVIRANGDVEIADGL